MEPDRSFETILHDINHAPTQGALWHIMLGYFHAQGVTMASYHAVGPDDTQPVIVTAGFPEDCVATYTRENLLTIDPIPELASHMARPFYWHEVRDLMTQTEGHKRYMAAMDAAHLGDGLAFYAFGPGLQNAYIGLGFGVDRIDLPPDTVFRFQCIAQAGHLRFCALHQAAAAHDLTDREREVLGWISKGKSNSAISAILDISVHTVDAHLRAIYRKLGVSDRTTAAIRGVGSGVIQFPAP